MSTKNVIIGTLAALAAGVVLGLLIAPEKGATTRQNLVKKSDELKDSLSEKIGAAGKIFRKKENDVPVRREEMEA